MGKLTGLSIGSLSKRSEVKPETVRYYEKTGLLPSPPRTASGYRQYPDSAVARLRFIRRARELGFSIKEICSLLELSDQSPRSCRRVHDIASAHLKDVTSKLADLRHMQKLLERTVRLCAEGTMAECPLLASLGV